MVLSTETFNQSVRTEYSEAVNARYTFQPLWVSGRTYCNQQNQPWVPGCCLQSVGISKSEGIYPFELYRRKRESLEQDLYSNKN